MLKTIQKRMTVILILLMLLQLFAGVVPVIAEDLSDQNAELVEDVVEEIEEDVDEEAEVVKLFNVNHYTKPVAGFGGALDFPTNSQSKITVPFNNDTKIEGKSNFTISMWIFPRENEPYQTLFCQEGDTIGSLGVNLRFIKHGDDEGYLYFGFNKLNYGWQWAWDWNNGIPPSNVVKIPINQWTNVALTKSGKSIVVYANGIKYHEMTLDDMQFNASAPYKGNISIGGSTTENQFFNGRIDEVQFWNTALTPAEIKAWMFLEIDSLHNKYSNLIYYYKLNQSTGTTVIDSKGFNNGTTVNMTDDNWVVSDVRGWATYIDENGDTKNTGDKTVTKITSDTDTLNDGWYIVEGDINKNGTIFVNGNVHLILEDSSSLTVTVSHNWPAISVSKDNSLTIYAQSKGDKMGFLKTTGTIGETGGSCGEITINGGTVTAIAGDSGSAGIGGGFNGWGGSVTINGGKVTAKGGYTGGAGIGAGNFGGNCTVTITGGEVHAMGGLRSAGIGGDDLTISNGTVTAIGDIDGGAGISGNVTISNGTITATGGFQNAGIEGTVTIIGGEVQARGGYGGAGVGSGDVTISNGIVTAVGGTFGAGIGGGRQGSSGEITIKGGTVTATGGAGGAGIGSGASAGEKAGSVTISGGKVTATGGESSAGIGGGDQSFGGTVLISDGEVKATGGYRGSGIGGGGGSTSGGNGGNVTISGGKVTATGVGGGAGIGGGGSSYNIGGFGGTIIIKNSPTVIATGKDGAADIGNGANGTGITNIKHGDVQGKDLTYLRIEVKNLTPDYVHKITINEQEHEINSEWLTGFFVEKSTESKNIRLEPEGALININPGDVQNSRITLSANHYENHYAKPVAGFGNALDFIANLQSRINVPFNNDTKIDGRSDFTISMWIFPKENEPYQTLYRQYSEEIGTLGVWLRYIKSDDNEGYLYFGFDRFGPYGSGGWQWAWDWNNGIPPSDVTKIPMNQWTHIALTKSGKSIIVYANGTKYHEMTLDRRWINTTAPSGGNISVGGTSAVNQFFNGLMDEIQFWDTALTSAEIQAWMFREIDKRHPNYDNLVYYYKLNQSIGNTITDSKGLNNGTTVNMIDGNWVASDVPGWRVNAGEILNGWLVGSHANGTSTDGTNWNLTFEIVEQGKKGTATITRDNQFEYSTHDISQEGQDSFTYRVKDSSGKYSNTQTVNIDIIPIPGMGNGNSLGSPSNSQSTNNANGKSETVATATTTREGDKTVTTVVIDDKKVEEKLAREGNNTIFTIPVPSGADVVIGTLNGQTVKNMENKDAVLEIKTGQVTYTLPASRIDIDDVAEQLGKQVELKDIAVSVKITEPAADTVKIIEDTANKNNYQIVVKPIEFEITCSSGDKTVEVSRFNAYVERMIAIPEGVDPSKISTGIILNDDGTFSPVPTAIIIIDGKYYAKINSLSNSIYAVINSPKTFEDVENHWAQKDIDDMASRLIINGVGNHLFEPERSITRAEFSAVMVRALGLRPEEHGEDFSDVKAGEWFTEDITTSSSYGLVKGYDGGTFKPNGNITRQEAMAILARAMGATKLGEELEIDASDILAAFNDNADVSGWAKDSVSKCVKTGVVTGRDNGRIAPLDNITRAETTIMVRRLLLNSDLINE